MVSETLRVWVLIDQHCGDCGQIMGVYSSRQLAENAPATKRWPNRDYRIEEHEVDSDAS